MGERTWTARAAGSAAGRGLRGDELEAELEAEPGWARCECERAVVVGAVVEFEEEVSLAGAAMVLAVALNLALARPGLKRL